MARSGVEQEVQFEGSLGKVTTPRAGVFQGGTEGGTPCPCRETSAEGEKDPADMASAQLVLRGSMR